MLQCPVMRTATVHRKTRETDIRVTIDLDGSGRTSIQTPVPFLSHMVDQIGRHGLFDLTVEATGDVEIDGHHTTEDLGIVLGQAVAQALGERHGIQRYGWATLPMDEARSTVSLDLGGRAFFVVENPLRGGKLGTFDLELEEVFFEAFARGAQANLHLVHEAGRIAHHMIEISFKAFAKALMQATRIDPRIVGVPSTKGTLTQ
jgi:imidazoleglycerol-phosphate dehydratase